MESGASIATRHAPRPVQAREIGAWRPAKTEPVFDSHGIAASLKHIHRPLYLVSSEGRLGVGEGGSAALGRTPSNEEYSLAGYVAPLDPATLGDPNFCADHGLRYPYITGAMANGIGSEEIVEAMAEAGMLGFFGAAGLTVNRVAEAVDRVQASVGGKSYGFNLIHSPNERSVEEGVVDLYIERGVHLVEASAFLQLTLPVVKYRVHGIHRDSDGDVITPNRIIAKVSRIEVATKFFSPPPEKFLQKLVDSNDITEEQAEMAREIPMAQDITAEADSGGHTDNRPAVALLPTLLALRDRLQEEFGYTQQLRVGLAGGISTPASAAAAFAMGAAYIMTGSVNQACVEAGTSGKVRQMLAETGQADVAMAPAADMFEMGVNLQVLKRGTMFSMRAAKLYELYRACESLDAIPAADREKLEKTTFRMPLDAVWNETRAFFSERDPRQIERAERDPKHKMALVFRWYLGQSSNWANNGVEDRAMDYQVWCGPAMGAFNEWVKDSFLEAPENRRVVTVGTNILYGAAVMARVASMRNQGMEPPREASHVTPLDPAALEAQLAPA